MGLFDNILKDNETLFKNELALDPSFQPKKISYRENENQEIATCIKPLFEKRNGKNLLIYGPPGIGKTLACKKVLEELEEKTDELMEIVAQKLNKKSVVFVLDEVDKLTDFSFLYSIMEDIYRKTIIMITNDKEFL